MRGKGKAHPKLENLFAELIFLADITTHCNKPYICLSESKTYSEIQMIDFKTSILWVNKLVDLKKLMVTNETKHEAVVEKSLAES